MPRKVLMTYEKSKNRWRKMVKGKLFLVQNSELGLPNGTSEEDGYQKANQWLEKQLSEERQKQADSHPYSKQLAILKEREAIARKLGFSEEADAYREATSHVEKLLPGVTIFEVLRAYKAFSFS